MSRLLKNYPVYVTSPYGNRSGGWHSGVDIVGEKNGSHLTDTVLAHSDGTVVLTQTGRTNNKGSKGLESYGNFVKIIHSNGYYTLYAHLKDVYVKVGQKVNKGDTIGYMGNTGNSYGAHTHFEVRNTADKTIEPTKYLTSDLPLSKPSSNSSTAATVSYKYTGYLDTVDDLHIAGWCYNGVNDNPVMVTAKIYNGSNLVKSLSANANVYRYDLVSAKIGNGYHAYKIAFDMKSLVPGSYTVKVFNPDGKQLTNTKKYTVEKKEAVKNFTLTKECYTFWSVAKKIGCSVADIQALNPTLKPNKLRVGQVIKVPNK